MTPPLYLTCILVSPRRRSKVGIPFDSIVLLRLLIKIGWLLVVISWSTSRGSKDGQVYWSGIITVGWSRKRSRISIPIAMLRMFTHSSLLPIERSHYKCVPIWLADMHTTRGVSCGRDHLSSR